MNKNIYYTFIITILCIFFTSCSHDTTSKEFATSKQDVSLSLSEAEQLVELPFGCIQKEFPYKAGLTIADSDDLQLPRVHHPSFYGCFDWHSAVHGHWSIVYLLSEFPELADADILKQMLVENLQAANIKQELAYFSLNEYTKSFERTYGWAWLLKLTEELDRWDDPVSDNLLSAIKPLADHIAQAYIDYLPKLAFPIRVGEHSNTAFGLSFAYDYAQHFKHTQLSNVIETKARSFYTKDQSCPVSWEPSGYDFLSPCLEEVDIMRKILPASEFKSWLNSFMPGLVNGSLQLTPAHVLDRSDGKLVHLSGLNFSRAWCLYPLVEFLPNHKDWIIGLADDHVNASRSDIFEDHYSGGHWLGTFILYALKSKSEI